MERVLSLLDDTAWKSARVTEADNSYGTVNPDVRSVLSQPLPILADGWPMAPIIEALAEANARLWRYDLTGFRKSDHPSVLLYEGNVQDHFKAHMDAGEQGPTRKLSYSLQLSDPATYRGGDLVLGGQFTTGARDQGSLTIFSSLAVHEVVPVYEGRRCAIVGWIHGPTFR